MQVAARPFERFNRSARTVLDHLKTPGQTYSLGALGLTDPQSAPIHSHAPKRGVGRQVAVLHLWKLIGDCRNNDCDNCTNR